jgi:uncharacterized protein
MVDENGVIRDDIEETLRSKGLFDLRAPQRYNLTVLTTTHCNLGCGYCFQNTSLGSGDRATTPQRINGTILDTPTRQRILSFAEKQMRAAALPFLTISLFGGEPLLNAAQCLALLREAGPIGMVSASMTTNGVLLTPEIATELNRAGLSTVQVTFDGAREQHDTIRVHRNGGPTFDRIVENIRAASRSSDINWDIRVNASHLNSESMLELVSELTDRLDPTRCTIGFNVIEDVGIGYTNLLTWSKELERKFISWSLAALAAGFNMAQPRAPRPCVYCSQAGGATGAVVNADGDLYSCWQTAGRPEWRVGNVSDGYESNGNCGPKWVMCGYNSQPNGREIQRFHDAIDAQVLDWMRDNKCLNRRETLAAPIRPVNQQ